MSNAEFIGQMCFLAAQFGALIVCLDYLFDWILGDKVPAKRMPLSEGANRVLQAQKEHIEKLMTLTRKGALDRVNNVNSRAWSIELAKAKLSYTSACKALGYLSRNKRTIERNAMMGQVNRLRTTIRELELIGGVV